MSKLNKHSLYIRLKENYWKISEFSEILELQYLKSLTWDELQLPPVFVVGMSRSGTTILTQLLTTYYHFSYFTNFTRMFIGMPCLATKLQNLLNRGRLGNKSLESNYGRTKGWRSPNDAARFWQRWFPKRDPYYFKNYNDVLNAELLKKEIIGLTNINKAPFITKDMRNSFRIPALNSLFPESLWIHLKRDPLYVAQSMWIAYHHVRKKKGVNRTGLIPLEYHKVESLEEPEKIVGQVYYAIRHIEKDLQQIDIERKNTIYYETLCEDPRGTLDNFGQWIETAGGSINKTGRSIPSKLISGNIQKIFDDDFVVLKASVKKWFSGYDLSSKNHLS